MIAELIANFILNGTYFFFLKKPFESIKKIADYLGKNLSDDQINQLVDFTSFSNLKQKEENKLLDSNKSFFDQDMSFFRKGGVGDWVNHFSEESAQRFDAELNKKLKYFRVEKYGKVLEKS